MPQTSPFTVSPPHFERNSEPQTVGFQTFELGIDSRGPCGWDLGRWGMPFGSSLLLSVNLRGLVVWEEHGRNLKVYRTLQVPPVYFCGSSCVTYLFTAFVYSYIIFVHFSLLDWFVYFVLFDLFVYIWFYIFDYLFHLIHLFTYLFIHSIFFRLCRCSQGSVYWLFLTSQMNFSRDPQQQENKHRQEGDESPSAFQTSNMSAETVEIIIKKKRIKIKNLNLLILSGLLFIIIRLPPCGRDLPRFDVVNFPWCASPVVEGRVASRLRVKGLKQAEGGHVDGRDVRCWS